VVEVSIVDGQLSKTKSVVFHIHCVGQQVTHEVDFALGSSDTTSDSSLGGDLDDLVLFVEEWDLSWCEVGDFLALFVAVEVSVLGHTFSMDFTVVRQVDLALVAVGELLEAGVVVEGVYSFHGVCNRVKYLVAWVSQRAFLLAQVNALALAHEVDFLLLRLFVLVKVVQCIAWRQAVILRKDSH